MRVTNKSLFDQMTANLQLAQSGINKIQGQISSGKKVEFPSDDPVVYTQANLIGAEQQVNTQLNRNLGQLKTSSTMYESTFNDVNDLLTQAKQLALTYADDSMANADSRKTGAIAVQDIIEHLVTLGNTKLANTYIFGGTQANQAPFELNPDYSVDYKVSLGARAPVNVYVDQGESTESGVSGQEVFYDKSKVLYENPTNSYRGDTSSSASYDAFVIDSANNTLYLNGSPVTLDAGIYRGSELAGQIQSKLGQGYYVTFDSVSGRFAIENRTGRAATFNWSNGGATAATLLGYDRLDATVNDGGRDVSDLEANGSSVLVKITQNGSTTGAIQERARYRYSLDGGKTWSAEEMIANYGRADTAAEAAVVDSTNNTIYENGTPVTLTAGTYTGAMLATEIQSQLNAVQVGHTVTYDAATRKFTITNGTGNTINLNWSNSGATAASLLGFNANDTAVATGASAASDVEAGLTAADTAAEFVVDSTNNTIYENGAPLTLTAGTYTGAMLATEIQSQLNAVQVGHTVTYDAATRKFTITNGTGNTINLNWSNSGATAASLLGFNANDTAVATGASAASNLEAGLSMGAVMAVGYQVDPTTNQLIVNDGMNDYTVTLNAGTYDGANLATQIQTQLNSTPLGAGLFAVSYNGGTNQFTIQNTGGAAYTLKWSSGNATARSLLGFNSSDTALAAGASTASDFATDPRNTIYKDGLPVTLAAGVYTAQGLAAEIQTKLGTGFQVSYDSALRQFAIVNNTGVPVTFNWSNSSTTLGAMLGFDNRDSTVINGGSDVSNFDAGMMIDGTNGANSTNSRLKIGFGSDGFLTTGDNFEIKDLDIFGFLKNLKDSLEQNNTAGIRNAIQDVDLSLDVVSKNITQIGMFTNKIDTLTQANTNRDYLYAQWMSPMVDADLAQLTTQLTTMMNSYQALVYSMAKMQDLSIMNYLR